MIERRVLEESHKTVASAGVTPEKADIARSLKAPHSVAR